MNKKQPPTKTEKNWEEKDRKPSRQKESDIAIIGMACRFPGANHYREFWANLVGGINSIREIPRSRWNVDEYYSTDFEEPNKSITRWSGLLEDIDWFDNDFFNISPREANNMDPQQRILLEETWHCLEDSGVSLRELRQKKTSVHIGATIFDYNIEVTSPGVTIDGYACTGNFMCILANRISYIFGFTGPSLSYDAACASSLAALHQAKISLINGECDYAIAGGICLLFHPWKYISCSQLRIYSPDGQCKTFDNDANGYVPGEGVGVVLLQRLGEAIKSRNHIYGIIKGSAVNHGGKALSLTAPRVEAQRDVILTAYQDAGFSPETVTYLEAHGTGTSLGDPIEIEALTQAFRKYTGKKQFCKIGTVKTNIGHLEPAAGIAGVIKVLLMMHHGKIPKTLNIKTLNPIIAFEDSPFTPASHPGEWQSTTPGLPLRAGISSFGFGGTNVHLLLEAFDRESNKTRPNAAIDEAADNKSPGTGKSFLFLLSAKSPQSLRGLIEKWKSLVNSDIYSSLPLEDICAQLSTGRVSFPHRWGVLTGNKDELKAHLLKDSISLTGKKKNGWLVRIGTFSWKPPQLQHLFLHNEWFNNKANQIERELAKLQQAKKIKKLHGKNIWQEPDDHFYSFMVGYSLVSGLMEPGLTPRMITGEHTGWFIALTVSGMLKLEDVLVLLSNQKRARDIRLTRPNIPVYDPVNEGIIMPYHFDDTYVRDMMKDLLIPADELNFYVKKARLLDSNQFTFKKLLEDWNPILKQTGRDTSRLLYDDELIKKQDRKSRNELLLLLMIIMSSLGKLYQKWDLTEQRPIRNQRFCELLELVMDDVLPKKNLIELLRGDDREYDTIARLLNDRQAHMTASSAYKYIKEKNNELKEIEDVSLWLEQAIKTNRSIKKSLLDEDIGELALGEICGAAAGVNHSISMTMNGDADMALKECMLQLWLQGVDLKWEILYPEGSFQKVSLPEYPFYRQRFWIEKEKEKKLESKLNSAVPQHLLSSPAVESNFPGTPAKPCGISLPPISNHTIPLSTPPGPGKPSTPLSPAPASLEGKKPKSKETLQEELKTSLAQALYMKHSDVGTDKKFVDMGLDSIVSVEWIQTLNKQYGISITAVTVYDYPTIIEFAEFLEKELDKTRPAATGATTGTKTSSMSMAQTREIIPVREESSTGLPGGKEPIAIVGMSGRYPGASHLHQYWQNLVQAKNSIREIPGSRWDVNRYYHPYPCPPGKIYCKWMGLLEEVEYFDPVFFNISPTETELMDPQHRLFLQEGYKAFEDAGLGRQSLSNKKCGVYAGMMSSEYGMLVHQGQAGITNITANNNAIAAARLSYFLNLKGPAIPIDTACSSSLVAIHLACQALLNHEIDMALVGGVSLYLGPQSYIGMCAAGMLSADGQCKSFDRSANGFVPAEGVGALVLKRLKDARVQHDSVNGLIIGSGINHDGNTNGITSPSMNSQIQLQKDIYHKYNISPESIDYVETHGTGTKLGDLIELKALAAVFTESTAKKNYCAVGSVKTNIGHTSAAAGMAGIHKVLLCMKHKQLVPTLNFRNPHEHFNFEDSPFYVNTRLKSWETVPGTPRRAAVSSFGFSGTNAHLVIEEYTGKTGTGKTPLNINTTPPVLFVLSARSKEQLKNYAESMKNFIASHEDLNLPDMAYTLQVGRDAMDYRLALAANSKKDVITALEGFINNNPSALVLTGQVKPGENEAPLFQSNENTTPLPDKLADLWVKGTNIDWNRLYGDNKPYRISLPTYPFARELCRISTINPRLNNDIAPAANPGQAYHMAPEIYAYDEPYLRDHTVYDEQVLIGVTHAGLALNAFFKIFPGENTVHLHRLSFVQPVTVKKGQEVEVRVVPVHKGSMIDFEVVYRDTTSAALTLTASGNLEKSVFVDRKIDIESIKDSLKEFPDPEQIYNCYPAFGLGDSFKTITQLYTGKEQALARVVLTRAAGEENHRYVLHPLVINSAFLAIFPILEQLSPSANNDGFLPFGIKDIHFRKTDAAEPCWIWVKLVKYSGGMLIFDGEMISDEFRLVAQFLGCSMKRLRSRGQFTETDHVSDHGTAPWTASQKQSHQAANPGPWQSPGKSNDLPGKIQKYLVNKIGKIISAPAKLSHLDINLMDLGLQSTQLVALTREISQETNIELFPTLFFEYPNIKELTGYFYREHPGAFGKLPGMSSSASPGTGVLNVESRPPGFIAPGEKAPREVLSCAKPEPFPGPARARDDIAVIGMHGLFAEAEDLNRFWEIFRDQEAVIKEIPGDHWDYRPWYDENQNAKDKIYCKWGSFIKDVDKFDAQFFNISPVEAEWMDPQLRLLLQSIYAAGEDAGYINQLRGTNTGVFVGVCCHDYADKMVEMNLPISPYLETGNSQTVLANRISFTFDFTGPSIAVNTACSSSLFALHYACQALRHRECDLAFVGGVNLLLSSKHYRYFCSIGALSPTGRCHTFQEAADGYVPGEGISSILLKPLPQAEKDGDHIYAVIKGSAALHGGYTPSLTAPSVSGEENVLVKAWEDAQIHPGTLGYLEAHGTGTKLGDPIEIDSLKKAFKRFTDKEQFCAVGSAKANIGHTEGAAGLAGILKVILQMQHGQIPAMPQFNRLNPYIRLEKSALYINREPVEWKTPVGIPRRAGVSSFGFSGAYAHVVIEEYIPGEPGLAEPAQIAVTKREPVIIPLSARNEERLREQVQRLMAAIRDRQFPDSSLTDIAYTLQVGREAMEERLIFIVESIHELREKLEQFRQEQGDMENLYQGQVKGHKETIALFTTNEELQEAVNQWARRGKYAELSDLWVKGLNFDWNKLYNSRRPYKPRRISLPTYAFARQRHWLPGPDTRSVASTTAGTGFEEKSPSSITRRSLPLVTEVEANFSKTPGKPVGISLQFPPQRFSIKEELRKSLAVVLSIKPGDIDVEDQLTDMGLDPMMSAGWMSVVNKQYGTSIPVTRLYEYPTINELAGFLERELNSRRTACTAQSSGELASLPGDAVPGLSTPRYNAARHQVRYRKPMISLQTLQEELRKSLAEVLHMECPDVKEDDKFVELGMDSISGVEWIRVINKQYGQSIPTTRVYDYPTLNEFARYLEKQLNKNGDSLDDLLRQVQQGTLDIEKADERLHRFL
jgi:polyketide synthase PksN